MLVRVEEAQPASSGVVRVHSSLGTVAVLWRGAAEVVGREHHVEWTVDEDIVWTVNAWPSPSAAPALREEGDRIVFRGQLSIFEDGCAALDVGGTSILFDLAAPPPPESGAGGAWVEVRVARDRVSLWPCAL
ncbi:hypothetical protein ACFVHW_31200 [Streptomyces sp. NPDC127110]|uniref:hypothetical protein n=1 Tax=Streptomyces sp. NPDC127110 TaxID=3345362 RepID=UPI00362B8C08